MRLKKSNIWLFFYQYINNKNKYPKDICSLFWGGLLGFIVFVLGIPFLFLKLIFKTLGYNPKTNYVSNILYSIISITIFFCSTAVGGLIIETFTQEKFKPTTLDFLYLWLIGFISFCIAFLVAALVIGFIINAEIYIKKKKRQPSVFIRALKDMKNRMCTLITWEDV